MNKREIVDLKQVASIISGLGIAGTIISTIVTIFFIATAEASSLWMSVSSLISSLLLIIIARLVKLFIAIENNTKTTNKLIEDLISKK